MNNLTNEPLGSFPYKPPSEEIKLKYKDLFELEEEIKLKLAKVIFDKVLSLICILFFMPILLILKIAYVIEGLLIPENSGPMFYYYYGISAE